MDNFFQKLRDIQKKETNMGTLSEIDDSFYDDASNYLQDLLDIVNDNPFSLETYQLRHAQSITIDICQKREAKIISTAITNVQKSHDIFKGLDKNSQLYEEIPYNLTPEEEKLYKDIINTIINHREDLMTEIIPHKNKETKIGFKPNIIPDKVKEDFIQIKRTDNSNDNLTASTDTSTDKTGLSNDKTDGSLNKIDSTNNSNANKPTSSALTESEIVAMYGQIPEDITEVAKKESESKTDITTPFKPPTVPKEDTISLQNEPTDNKQKISSNDLLKDKKSKENIELTKQSYDETDTEDDTEDIVASDDILYDNEELVVFKEEITTDILDENEKTYGPFEVSDMALLPQSIVKILDYRHIIDVIK